MSTKKVNQKLVLVDCMQSRYSILFGKFSCTQGKETKANVWNEIVDHVNQFGPPFKDAEKWKKTWLDLRNEVKKKYQQKRQNENQTGAAPTNIIFSELDERISAIVGKQLLDGDDNVFEIGFGSVEKKRPLNENDGDDENDNDSVQFQMYGAKSNVTPSKAKKRLFEENEDSLDFDGVEKTHNKRAYRSTTTQVERALVLQQQQVDLLQKIANQNEEILKLLKQQSK